MSFNSTVSGTLTANGLLVPSGNVSFPAGSVSVAAITGLASIATSGAASNLAGVLAQSNIPNLSASNLNSGTFSVGSFGVAVKPSVDNSYALGSSANRWASIDTVSANVSNLTATGTVSMPPNSLSTSYVSGLASFVASNTPLIGLLSTSNIPNLPAPTINSGTFSVGSFGTAVVPSTDSTYSLGTSSNKWSNLYSVGATVSNMVVASNLTASGTVSFPSNSLTTDNISGLAGFVLSNAPTPSNVGLLSASNIPSLPASKITSGNFSVGSFGVAVTPSIDNTYSLGATSNQWAALYSVAATLCNVSVTGALTCSSITSTQHIPATTSSYDLGTSSLLWRNAYLSGNITASTYTGLPRKYWNATSNGAWNASAGTLYKVASIQAVGSASNGGSIRISGTIGGFYFNQSATVDCLISSRGGYCVKGSATGYVSSARTFADPVAYSESNGSFTIYLKVVAQFVSWDLSIEAAGTNVTAFEPTSTTTPSPTGTLNTSSVLSVLNVVTEMSNMTTSFNNFSFASNATDLTWAVQGSSNGGSISCGPLASASHNPTTTATYDLGSAGSAWRNAYLSSNLSVAGTISSSNGLTVSGGTVSLPAGSVTNTALAALDASKITTGTFGTGLFGANSISTTGTLGAGASTLGSVSCTTLTTNNNTINAGTGALSCGIIGGTSLVLSSGARVGGWSVPTVQGGFFAWNRSGTGLTAFANARGTGSGGWEWLAYDGSLNSEGVAATLTQSGSLTINAGLSCTTITTNNCNVTVGSGSVTSGGLNPASAATYDLGSSASNWRNAYLSGSVTAATFVGMQRKTWNSTSLGISSIAANSYFKLATMLDYTNTSSGGGLRVVGQLGGYGNSQTATVDCSIVTRGIFYVRGAAQGYIAGAKQRADIAVYMESDGKYSIYYYNPAQFSIWDLSVEAGLGVTLYEPTSTSASAPTGTLVTSSVLSVLTTTSEFSSGTVTTSFNSFGFSNSAASGNPTWTPYGSSNSGSILSGSITSGQHNPSLNSSYDLGTTTTAWRNAYLSGNLVAASGVTSSNGLTVSNGTVSLPAGSLGVTALTGVLSTSLIPNLNASNITSGTFSVGQFGSTALATTGTLSAGSSLLSGICTGSSNSSALSAYQISAVATTPRMALVWPPGANYGSLDFCYSNSTVMGTAASARILASDTSYSANLAFQTRVQANDSTTMNTWLYINGANGQVGIGSNNTAPAYTLDVSGTFRAAGAATFGSNVNVSGALSGVTASITNTMTFNSGDQDKMILTNAGATASKITHEAGWGVGYYAGCTSAVTGTHKWYTGYAGGFSNMMVLNSGYLGIGNTSPTYNLDVTGTARVTSSASFSSNVAVTGPLVAAGGLTSSNGLTVSAGTASFGGTTSYTGTATFSSNVVVVNGLTSSNGLTVSAGTVTFPSASIAASSTTGTFSASQIPNLNASNITSGAFSVGTFATSVSASNAANTQFALLSGATANNAQFGLAAAASNYSTSAAVGDAILRCIGGNVMIQSGSGPSALYVNSNNAVGVGNASPQYKLDVTGTINSSGGFNSATTGGLICSVTYTGSGSARSLGTFVLNQALTGGGGPLDTSNVHGYVALSNIFNISPNPTSYNLNISGYINIPAAQTFTFYTVGCDDNIRVYIDGTLVLAAGLALNGSTASSNTTFASAGWKNISIVNQNTGGNQQFKLQWATSGTTTIAQTDIPGSNLAFNQTEAKPTVLGGPCFIDNFNNRLGVGTLSPANMLHVSGGTAQFDSGITVTGAVSFPNSSIAAAATTGTFTVTQIPSLDASKITTGAFGAALIPSLDASKITTGSFSVGAFGTTAITCGALSTGNSNINAGTGQVTANSITTGSGSNLLVKASQLSLYSGADPNFGVKLWTNNTFDGIGYGGSNEGGLASWWGISLRCTWDSTERHMFDTRSGNANFLGSLTLGTSGFGPNALNVTGTASVSGSVGIGNTAPLASLHTSGDMLIGANNSAWPTTGTKGLYMRFSTNGTQNEAYIQSRDFSAANAPLYPLGLSGSNIALGGTSPLSTPTLYVAASGYVGLSTNSPSCALDFGTGGANKQLGLVTQTAGWYGIGAANSAMQYQTGGAHTFYVGSTSTALGTSALNISSAGNTSIAGSLSVTSGVRVSSSSSFLQSTYGSIGFISYSDGATYYQLATNAGDSGGGFNSLRPFNWSLSTGNVSLANNQVTFAHSTGAMTCTSISGTSGTFSGGLSASTATTSANMWVKRTFSITGATLYSTPTWWKIATFAAASGAYCSGCLTVTGLLANVNTPITFTANIGFHTQSPSFSGSLTYTSANSGVDLFASGVFDIALYLDNNKNLYVYAKQNANYLSMSLDATCAQFEGNGHTIYPSTSFGLSYTATNTQLMAADPTLASVLSSTSFYATCGSNIVLTKGSVTSCTQLGVNTTSPAFQLDVSGTLRSTSTARFDSNVTVAGGLSVTAGQNILVPGIVGVNDGTDTGAARGVRYWSYTDPGWATYMCTAGASKSTNSATTCTSLDGRSNHHIRHRARSAVDWGFIWENDAEQCLMSLTGDTGSLFIKGNIGSPAVPVGGTTYLKAVGCSSIACSSLTASGTVSCATLATGGAITTTGTGSYDIGTNANKFGNLFTSFIYPTNFVTNLIPNSNGNYDVGVSGGNYWRNAYLTGTVTAATYTGLPRKYWNAFTQGVWGGPTGALFKIASLPAIGDASGGGTVRICGSLGGFGTNQSATLDCTLSSRGAYAVKGTAHGYVANAKTNGADIVTYVETNGKFTVYIKNTGFYVCWDLSVEPGGMNVSIFEPSNTNTTSPTGTLNTASVLSVLGAVTEFSTSTTSFANYSFSSNATDLTWAATGSSTGGAVSCGGVSCSSLTTNNGNLDTGGGTLKVNNMSLSYGSGPLYMQVPSINVYGGGSINNGTFIVNNSQQGTAFGTNQGGLGSFSGLSFKCMGDSTERHLFDTTTGNSVFKGSLSVGQSTYGSNMLNVTGGSLSLKSTTDSSVSAGAHVYCYGATDSNPLFQQLNWGHDNISMNFDMQYNGAWVSSSTSSYQIYKTGGQLRFNYSAAAAGSTINTITASTAICIASNGQVGINNQAPAYNLDVTGTLRATGAITCTGLTSSSGLGVTSSATGSIGNMTTTFAPSLATGNYFLCDFGTAQSGNNCGYLGFYNTGGAGSSNNYAAFGMYGYAIGSQTFNACGNGNFGLYTISPAYTLDISGSLRATGAASLGNVTCGTLGTQGNTISAGVIGCTGVNPGTTATYDLGTSSLAWRNAYFSGTHYNSGTAGFTAGSTAALTPAAPFHFFAPCDANNNNMIIGNPSGGTGIILEDLVNAKWKIQTFNYALGFLQQTSGTTSSYGTANFTSRVYFDSNANVHAASLVNTSDRRIKCNIRPIESALDRICQIQGKVFDYLHPEDHNNRSNVAGFVAQEIQEVFPDWITTCPIPSVGDAKEVSEEEPLLGISLQQGLDAHLVESIKQLKHLNEGLAIRVAALEASQSQCTCTPRGSTQ